MSEYKKMGRVKPLGSQLSRLADFRWGQACIIAFLTLQRTEFLNKNAIKQA
jgi:hypothetical protein